MNQILKPNINQSDDLDSNNKYTRIKFHKIQLIVSSFIAFCFVVLFFVRIYKINKNEKLSNQLVSKYHISTLYSNTTNYSAHLLQSNSETNVNNESNTQDPFVIGMLKIDKIGINYPILSESNKELLEISLCRFAGPMPNKVGNLCIAGHNYVDYKLFSRLHELNVKDKFLIYDLNGNVMEYSIFKKYEVKVNDTSCTYQETNGETIVTLLTCNNVSGKRLVVVAKAILK